MTGEQQVEAIKAIADVLKHSKMFQMIIAFWMLQGLRMAKKDNKCWQGVITMLQSIVVGGYLSSEMEGEIASLLGIGTAGAGSIMGAIECAEEAGWYPYKMFGEMLPDIPGKREAGEMWRKWWWPL